VRRLAATNQGLRKNLTNSRSDQVSIDFLFGTRTRTFISIFTWIFLSA